MKKWILWLMIFLLVGCGVQNLSEKEENKSADSETKPEQKIWIDEKENTTEKRFLPPDGYERVASEENSFAKFIREYPLKDYGAKVMLFDGRAKPNQSDHEAVFDMKLGNRDLQQCADSIMRIYAEYLYRSGQKDKIAFHFVQGFLCDYTHWKDGYRVVFDSGGNPSWAKKADAMDNEEVFEKYLNMVFSYCSTLSMAQESQAISIGEIQIGDIFIQEGSPGHVVMVVDMCQNQSGDKMFLLAQGFMPAQEFHILKNPSSDSPWYDAGAIGDELVTPQYRFDIKELRRVNYAR